MRHNFLDQIIGVTALMVLGGCSINDSDNTQRSQQSKTVLNTNRAVINTHPVISVPKATSNKKPVKASKPYKPQIKQYRESKPAVRILTDKEQAAFNKAMIKLEKKRREVDDPYASIPDNSSSQPHSSSNQAKTQKPISQRKSDSSAVNSLILQAHAEMLIGKYLSAENKIERGLRIEPENPKLWGLLAKAHYEQSNYSQSINMSRKAIQFSRDDDLTARNWRLIKKSGEKSGDTNAVKEAIDYTKINP
jgi:tetratricopeptide (TPR) repeat protein